MVLLYLSKIFLINLAAQNIIAILDLSLNLMQKEMMNHSISSVLSSGIQSIVTKIKNLITLTRER